MKSEIKVVNVSDEEDVQTPRMHDNPKRQTHVFGDDKANVRITPSASYDSPITKACNLPCVQGKLNKKLKRKKRWLSISSYIITNAINNFTHLVKEIELKKMEMTKFVTSQMLQNEKKGKQMMIQGQLQLVALFIDVLKPKTSYGNGSIGN
jgi:hypothetical protein